jgi:hypothetical protein
MMEIEIYRSPGQGAGPYDSPVTFKGYLDHVSYPKNRHGVRLTFQTGFECNHSDFEAIIWSECFASLAELMMQIDPDAAIRAFGAALQTAIIKINSRDPTS